MPCYHPIRASQRKAGGALFFGSPPRDAVFLQVPCGQCIGCRLEYARDWALRCVHESKMHDENCFLTLTYDDEHLPDYGFLRHADFQLFMKRLRYYLRRNSRPQISFFMCGEYGTLNWRPHYHAGVFGLFPIDAVYWKTSDSGYKIYRSDFLDSVWQLGAVYVGMLSFDSAGYIARYAMKKQREDNKEMVFLNVATGEIFVRPAEYAKMSTKPAIGKRFVQKYGESLFVHDNAVVNKVEQALPRYYDKLLDDVNPVYLAEIKAARRERGEARQLRLEAEASAAGLSLWDVHRLKVQEQVVVRRIKSLKRS